MTMVNSCILLHACSELHTSSCMTLVNSCILLHACSELEGDLRAKDQQLLKTQDSLREAQEDLARDEVIFGGKVKELAQLRDANQQLQVKLLLSRVHRLVPRNSTGLYITLRLVYTNIGKCVMSCHVDLM